ncbi:hypothetical protein QBC39DRAFT_398790 [Podospora conica]|nr:hypothetical protein QBC39DRAFT_398790 [Schizothecium conicum]
MAAQGTFGQGGNNPLPVLEKYRKEADDVLKQVGEMSPQVRSRHEHLLKNELDIRTKVDFLAKAKSEVEEVHQELVAANARLEKQKEKLERLVKPDEGAAARLSLLKRAKPDALSALAEFAALMWNQPEVLEKLSGDPPEDPAFFGPDSPRVFAAAAVKYREAQDEELRSLRAEFKELQRLEREAKEQLAALAAQPVPPKGAGDEVKKIEKLRSQKKDLERDKRTLESDKADLEREKASLQRGTRVNERDIASLREQVRGLKDDNKDLRDENKNLNSQNRKAGSRVTLLETREENLKGKITTLESEKTTLESEKTTLESEKATLEDEKTTLEDDKTTLEDEKKSLEREKLTLEQDVINIRKLHTENAAKIETKNKNLETEIQTLSSRNRDLETENQSLSTAREELTKANDELETANGNLCTENEVLTEAIKVADGKYSALSTRCDELESDEKDLKKRVETLQDELDTTSAVLKSHQEDYNVLHGVKVKLQSTVGGLQSTVNGNRTYIPLLEGRITKLNATVASLTGEKSQLTEDLGRATGKSSVDAQAIDRLEGVITQLNATVASLTEEKLRLTEELERAADKSQADAQAIDRLEGVITQLNATADAQAIDRLEGVVADNAKSIKTLQDDVANKATTIASLGDDVTGKAETLADLRQSATEQQKVIDALKDDVADKTNIIAALEEDATGKGTKITGLQEQIDTLKGASAEMAQKIQLLEGSEADKAKQIETLGLDVGAKVGEIAGLKNEVAGLKNEVAGLKNEVAAALEDQARQVDTLNQTITDQSARIGELDAAVANLNGSLASVTGELANARQSLEAAKRELEQTKADYKQSAEELRTSRKRVRELEDTGATERARHSKALRNAEESFELARRTADESAGRIATFMAEAAGVPPQDKGTLAPWRSLTDAITTPQAVEAPVTHAPGHRCWTIREPWRTGPATATELEETPARTLTELLSALTSGRWFGDQTGRTIRRLSRVSTLLAQGPDNQAAVQCVVKAAAKAVAASQLADASVLLCTLAVCQAMPSARQSADVQNIRQHLLGLFTAPPPKDGEAAALLDALLDGVTDGDLAAKLLQSIFACHGDTWIMASMSEWSFIIFVDTDERTVRTVDKSVCTFRTLRELELVVPGRPILRLALDKPAHFSWRLSCFDKPVIKRRALPKRDRQSEEE